MSSGRSNRADRALDRASILLAPVAWILEHWLPVTVFAWMVGGALYLTLPPSPDQASHAYLGWRLLEGDIPYRDVIDTNWPGAMSLHALAIWIFGVNLWSWRALDFALFAASALFLTDLVRSAAGRDAARINLILCPLIYAGLSYWLSGQHDMSAAQFLVGAVWCHVRGYEKRAWWYQIGTGLCIGAAMLNKPTIGVVGLLLPIHAFWARIPLRPILSNTAIAGSASVAALLAALCALLARGASLREVLDAVYTFNVGTQYAGPQSVSDMLQWFLQFHFQFFPSVAIGSVPAVLWMVNRAPRSMAATALLMLWATGALSYFLQWRGLNYHLAPCLVAMSAGLAISVPLVAAGRADPDDPAWKRPLVVGLVVLALAGIAVKLAASYRSLPLALLNGEYGPHLARFEAGDEITYADVTAFVRRLDAIATTDCVLLVGDASSINYLSRRRMPTRFYYYHSLVQAQAPLPMAERWSDLWAADLRAANCGLTLVSRSVASGWLAGAAPAAETLRQLLIRYRETGSIGSSRGIAVYEPR